MDQPCSCARTAFCARHMPRDKDGNELAPRLTYAERAVIEAAKALCAVFDTRGWAATAFVVARVYDAVEALEAAEKGGSVTASDLKPGDVIRRCPSEPGLEGWTVEVTEKPPEICWQCDGPLIHGDYVLLKLERDWYLEGHDVNGEEVWWACEYGKGQKTTARTAWLEADAEVET